MMMDEMGSMMGLGWIGMGAVALLLVLAIAALIKYLMR